MVEYFVRAKELAECLDISVQRVGALRKDGIFDQVRRPEGLRYSLGDAVLAYVRFIKKGGDGKTGKAGFEEQKAEAEARLKQTKAKIADLQLKELLGQMHRAEDVRDMTSDLIFSMRSALAALPGRLAVDVSGRDNPAEVSEIIKREVNLVMEELAEYQYDPDAYAKKVREREGVTPDGDEDDEEYDNEE